MNNFSVSYTKNSVTMTSKDVVITFKDTNIYHQKVRDILHRIAQGPGEVDLEKIDHITMSKLIAYVDYADLVIEK